jgi:hypothetical protein
MPTAFVTAKPFKIAAVALVAATSACAASVNIAPDCPYDDNSFNDTRRGMQSQKGACPPPQ